MIERQIKVIEEEERNICEVIKSLELTEEDGAFIPSFIHLYLADRVQEDFGLEEEDLISAEN